MKVLQLTTAEQPFPAPTVAGEYVASAYNAGGTRVYLMRLYNSNLSKAQLDTNWNGTKARFGL